MGLVWSPDGKFLISSMQEAALHGWRIADAKDMRMGGYPSKVKSLAFLRDGMMLATSGALVSALMVALAALAYGYVRVSNERDRTARRETETRAEMLLSAMNSVRQYTTNNVRPALTEALKASPRFVKESRAEGLALLDDALMERVEYDAHVRRLELGRPADRDRHRV